MNEPNPSITVAVDPTNPGQFFACCGLLELADRLWPGAEGWFAPDGQTFYISLPGGTNGTLRELLVTLGAAKMESSLTDQGMKRLASLLSAKRTSLSTQDEEEKKCLRASWQRERISLLDPFNLTLDWWWDDNSGVKRLKTWAAKQFVLDIARPMLEAIKRIQWTKESLLQCLSTVSKLSGLPFYFDGGNNTQSTPRDYGVAPFETKQAPSERPLVELLTFIALQRFRPYCEVNPSLIWYSLWLVPLAPSVAGAVVSGAMEMKEELRYNFQMLYRTEYMKAFLPAHPSQGD